MSKFGLSPATRKPPEVRFSVVIPTYNHLKSDLMGCVESLESMTDLSDGEVIVVSNGSTDGTSEYVNGLGGPFRCLSYPEPLGYTKATNAGIAVAMGEFVILCNNDNVFLDWGGRNGWLNTMLAPFSDPKVAMTGPARQWRGGRPWLIFFLVAIRRRLFNELGYLDESFNPGAGEDTDFGLRVQTAGYKVRQVPQELPKSEYALPFPIYHKGGQTVSQVPGWAGIVARNEKILRERYGMGSLEEGK